jgi:hypothetical protein
MDYKKKYLKYKNKYLKLKYNNMTGGGEGCLAEDIEDKDIIPCNQEDERERKKNFLKQSRIFHPDKNIKCPEVAKEKFTKLTEICPENGAEKYDADNQKNIKNVKFNVYDKNDRSVGGMNFAKILECYGMYLKKLKVVMIEKKDKDFYNFANEKMEYMFKFQNSEITEDKLQEFITNYLYYEKQNNVEYLMLNNKAKEEFEQKYNKAKEETMPQDNENNNNSDNGETQFRECYKSEYIKNNFRSIPVNGDGNCFYRVLEEYDKLRDKTNYKSYKTLRKEIYEYVKKNKSKYRKNDEYIERINEDGEWATDFEIGRAAELFDIQFVVYRLNDDVPTLIGNNVNNRVYLHNCSLVEGGDVNHYELLIPKNNYKKTKVEIDDEINYNGKETEETKEEAGEEAGEEAEEETSRYGLSASNETHKKEKKTKEEANEKTEETKEEADEETLRYGLSASNKTYKKEEETEEEKYGLSSSNETYKNKKINENDNVKQKKNFFKEPSVLAMKDVNISPLDIKSEKSLGGNNIPYKSFPLMTIEEYRKNKHYNPKIIK